MGLCPAYPHCPYCDDDGAWEREAEEAALMARLEAHANDDPPTLDELEP